MPTRTDIELATPLCRNRYIRRNGQHGTHHTCWQPLRYYHQPTNSWVCLHCLTVTPASEILAQRHALVASQSHRNDRQAA